MNTEYFIARRMLKGNNQGLAELSRPIVRIATLAVMLGITVMIVAIAIVTGFQKEIRDKVISFGSHIQINNYDFNTSYEPTPITTDQKFLPELRKTPGIQSVHAYASKAGIIKTDTEIQGVVMKGVGTDFDWAYFSKKLTEGDVLTLSDSSRSNDILISRSLATKLGLHVGEKVNTFFIEDPTHSRSRNFLIKGIYETGLEEFDNLYVFCDIQQIRKLNDWAPDQAAGFEVLIDNYKDIDRMGTVVNDMVGYQYLAQTIKELYPQLFDWLNLQDMNVVVILVLMSIVVVLNMTTAILILILERTSMIGILKSMGASNWQIRNIFLYNAGHIISRGMLWGNLTGIGLCLLQQYFGIIPLDQSSYYLSQVPINLQLSHLLIMNAAAFVVIVAVMILPTYLVAHVSPVRALRFS
ncbi:MAG: ABC transporter permease [Flavobacteriales bacterium]|nr:ABC transporter permease [Flavobacteriales bacterium]MCB9447476.1 ABC transporter permease [Flavobacteriales bacterium]